VTFRLSHDTRRIKNMWRMMYGSVLRNDENDCYCNRQIYLE
jgi:hypothetical protein